MLGRVRQASRMFQTLLLQACTAAAADPWSWNGAAAVYLARSHPALSQGACAVASEAECHRMVPLCVWDPAGSTLRLEHQLNSPAGYHGSCSVSPTHANYAVGVRLTEAAKAPTNAKCLDGSAQGSSLTSIVV